MMNAVSFHVRRRRGSKHPASVLLYIKVKTFLCIGTGIGADHFQSRGLPSGGKSLAVSGERDIHTSRLARLGSQ